MEVQGVRINELVNQSLTVLKQPSVQSFELYEKRGGKREALIYVLVAAAVAGVISGLIGLIGGGILGLIVGLIAGTLIPVATFYTFAYVLHFVGKQQGGTGTEDEVFYTCALYTAPLLAIGSILSILTVIPILGLIPALASLILVIYQIYLGYLATRSSLNLAQNPAIITVVAAIVAQVIVTIILNRIFIM
jgi:hypothetical protein